MWEFEHIYYRDSDGSRPRNFGYTVAMSKELGIVSLSRCGKRDSFSRKSGRDAALARADKVKFPPDERDPSVVIVVVPPVSNAGEVETLRSIGLAKAHKMLRGFQGDFLIVMNEVSLDDVEE